jgi:hypothetical protein
MLKKLINYMWVVITNNQKIFFENPVISVFLAEKNCAEKLKEPIILSMICR